VPRVDTPWDARVPEWPAGVETSPANRRRHPDVVFPRARPGCRSVVRQWADAARRLPSSWSVPDDGRVSADATGHAHTVLIVLRGNSGSGKSTIARDLQLRHGRGCALVQQDHLRRVVLRERDRPGGIAPALIAHTARFALDHGYHVVVEGIMTSGRYRDMLAELCRSHRGRTGVFYLNVSLEETLRRHQTRPQAAEFTAEHMRGWYTPRDVLGLPGECTLPESTTVEEAVVRIATTAGLPLLGGDDDVLPAFPAGHVPAAP
jgi:predicted kinase